MDTREQNENIQHRQIGSPTNEAETVRNNGMLECLLPKHLQGHWTGEQEVPNILFIWFQLGAVRSCQCPPGG